MRALGESFNIKILATSAESPWSNGVCERLNAVLGNMVSKISDDAKCDVHTALAWAVSARNAFDNNGGFSPNQLVFGFNPSIPNVFNNNLPAMEEVTASEMVRKHLNAKQAAWEAFMKCESSEKISRALRNNIRNTEVDDLRNGDDVYYKRNDGQKWHGPGQVIGFNGKQVLVKHGGTFVRVHTTRLTKLPGKRVIDISQDHGDALSNNRTEPARKRVRSELDLQDGKEMESTDIQTGEAELQEGGQEMESTDIQDRGEYSNKKTNSLEDGQERGSPGIQIGDTSFQGGQGMESTGIQIGETGLQGGQETERIVPETRKMAGVWRSGQRFQGLDASTGQHISGKIINRAGKVRGINKDCYNIVRDSDGW